MRVSRYIVWTICVGLWFNGTPCKAQLSECKAVISGVLHDENHRVLVGATVFIKELKIGTATDLYGKYYLKKLCHGSYTLVFSYLGYKSREITILVNADEIEYDLDLEDEAIHLEEIAIEQKKLSLAENQTQAVSSLDESDLIRNAGGNLAESLGKVTGVNILQSGPSVAKPVIHGLHSNRILILNNGIRQEEQQWGTEHAPTIDPFVANNLSLIKGAAAVRYGSDAIAGVILVNPAELPQNKSLKGSIQTIGQSNGRGATTSALLEGGLGKGLGWRIQGTFKRLGDAESPHYVLSNTGHQEVNFSAALGWQKENYGFEAFYSQFNSEIAILKSAHIGGLDDLERSIDNAQPAYVEDFTYTLGLPRQELSHHLFKTKAYLKLPNLGKLELLYGFQFNTRKEFDIRRSNRSDKPALFLELGTHTLDWVLEHKPWGNFQGSLGIQGIFQNNLNQDLAERGIRPLIPNYKSYSGGVFWIERYVKNRFELEAGIRYDYRRQAVKKRDFDNILLTPVFDYQMFSGTLGLIYHVNKFWSFRTNLASAMRSPNPAELFSEGLHHGIGSIEEGNTALEVEKSYKWISTLRFQNTRLNLEFSPYYHYIQDYIFLEPREVRLTIRGAFPVFRYNQSNAVFWGADMAFKYHFTPFLSFNSNISFIQAKNVTDDAYLPFIPANQLENGLTLEWKKWHKLENIYLSLSVENHLQQNRAPQEFTIAQIREVLENDALSLPEKTFDFVEAPPGFTLINLDAGFDIPWKKQDFSIHFSIDNLFNTAYRDYMNRFRYFADDQGRNFTLRLRYSFQTSKYNP